MYGSLHPCIIPPVVPSNLDYIYAKDQEMFFSIGFPADCDPSEIIYYYGAASPQRLLHSFRTILKERFFKCCIGVLHVPHIELEEVCTRNLRYNSKEVHYSAASFVNVA